MKKNTLSTIAKQAKVSIATVSRVLKKPHLTSSKIQSKVHQAIQELDISTFDINTTYDAVNITKAILIIDNQFMTYSLINHGLEQVLKLAGYKLVYIRFSFLENNDIHQLIRYISFNLFDGIVVINDAPYLEALSQYTSTMPPIILVNHFHMDFNCVYFDHLMMAYQITKHLIAHSHYKIAVLLSHHDKISSKQFLQGYQQALHRANLTLRSSYIIHDCFTYEHGQLAVKNLLSSNKPPTAIICADNICLNYMDEKYYSEQHYLSPYNSVLGALDQASKSQAHHLPSFTLAYISHSKLRQYNELDTLNRIYKPLYKMGQQAASLLCEILNNSNISTKQHHIIESETIFY